VETSNTSSQTSTVLFLQGTSFSPFHRCRCDNSDLRHVTIRSSSLSTDQSASTSITSLKADSQGHFSTSARHVLLQSIATIVISVHLCPRIMYRPAARTLQRSTLPRSFPRTPGAQRFASTTSRRTGSWKGTAVRWGLAGSTIYYYNTSNIFAEEPACT